MCACIYNILRALFDAAVVGHRVTEAFTFVCVCMCVCYVFVFVLLDTE
jgi:hypothetical protein